MDPLKTPIILIPSDTQSGFFGAMFNKSKTVGRKSLVTAGKLET